MLRPRLGLCSGLALAASVFSTSALAQPRPPAPKPPPATTTPPLTGAQAIEVNDPMLAPLPRAAHTLGSWRDVVTYITSRNADLLIARAEIERSRGLWRQALGAALPTLVGQASLTYQIVTPPAAQANALAAAGEGSANPTALAQLTAAVPIFALQTWYSIGTAKRATNLATLNADDRSRVILATVANSLITLVTTERVAEVNRVGLKSSLQTLELTERKMRLGSGTKLDVVRAQQDVAAARATLVTGDEGVRKAREALGLALGFHDDWGIAPSVNLDLLGNSVRQICSATKPDERSDVLAAKSNLDISERGVTGSYLAYAPTVQASTTLQAANTTLGSGHDYAWSIQGLLSWNIFDGGIRYGTTRIAKADVLEKKASLDVALRGATLDVTQANRGVTVAEASKGVAQESRDLAKETARLSQVAFEAGTGTSFDLVTSQSLARQTELALANAEFTVIQAKLTAMLAASSCKY